MTPLLWACRRCGDPTKPSPRSPGPERRASGRGLCGSCYGIVYRTGEIVDYPRRARSREDVIEDWKNYRARYPLWTKSEIAQLMGMKAKTLSRALTRARQAGMEVPFAC